MLRVHERSVAQILGEFTGQQASEAERNWQLQTAGADLAAIEAELAELVAEAATLRECLTATWEGAQPFGYQGTVHAALRALSEQRLKFDTRRRELLEKIASLSAGRSEPRQAG